MSNSLTFKSFILNLFLQIYFFYKKGTPKIYYFIKICYVILRYILSLILFNFSYLVENILD